MRIPVMYAHIWVYLVINRGWGFRLLTRVLAGAGLAQSTTGDIGGIMGFVGTVGVLRKVPCILTGCTRPVVRALGRGRVVGVRTFDREKQYFRWHFNFAGLTMVHLKLRSPIAYERFFALGCVDMGGGYKQRPGACNAPC